MVWSCWILGSRQTQPAGDIVRNVDLQLYQRKEGNEAAVALGKELFAKNIISSCLDQSIYSIHFQKSFEDEAAQEFDDNVTAVCSNSSGYR